MSEIFHPSQPIYLQLVDRISRQILRGELKPGEKLPSVRDMGIQVGVNPNTVQRTYRELETLAIVETKRGQGTFITEDTFILNELRERLKEEVISHFVDSMVEMGYSSNEMSEGLQLFLQRQNGDVRND